MVFRILTKLCKHHHYLIWNIFITPESNPVSIVTPNSPSLPSPWQLLIYFPSLCICLFWTFHINGIIRYAVFYDQLLSYSMFSRVIHVVARITISFLFIEQLSIIWVYHIFKKLFISCWIWVVSALRQLWIMLLWTFVYKILCERTFSDLRIGVRVIL